LSGVLFGAQREKFYGGRDLRQRYAVNRPWTPMNADAHLGKPDWSPMAL
jgi:hypothetical protein